MFEIKFSPNLAAYYIFKGILGGDSQYLHSDGKVRSSCYNEEGVFTGWFASRTAAEKCLNEYFPPLILKDVKPGQKFRFAGEYLHSTNEKFILLNSFSCTLNFVDKNAFYCLSADSPNYLRWLTSDHADWEVEIL